MFGLNLDFEEPKFLLLLLLLPLLWWLSFRSLSGLGNFRRIMALLLRTVVVAMIVMALADVQLLRISDKVTVIYLLDQSDSIPLPRRQQMLEYVVDEVEKHRNNEREDRAGVIVFGREASIEIPPFDDDIPSVGMIESYLGRTDATNLASALKLAQASFPEDSARRIVVVTDGNENMGDARSVAPMLADHGIGIDVVAVKLTTQTEISVDKVVLPADIRRGQPIEARVVISSHSEPGVEPKPVDGDLKIVRRMGRDEEPIFSQRVRLDPGKNVFSFEHTVESSAMFTYEATFVPDNPKDDLMLENNRASAFTHVRGKGHVLLIEDADNPNEFDFLIGTLRRNNIEVTTMPSNRLFTSLAELQQYDSVVLANVPRTSGDTVVTSFSDQQIEMLVRNTEQMGCGLVMLGGQNSFGVGGWSNTKLEEAMPVDFQIKNAKIQAVGALVLLMHASEMAQGNHWQKVVAREAIQVLGPMDYCGLIHWGIGADAWLWGGNQGLVQVGTRKKTMLAQVSRMTPGDMPQFDPAMRMAMAGFNRVNASVKHMIIISDGDPSPPAPGTIAAFRNANVQITTVAVGTHGPAGSTPLQNIASATGGKYYVATNPKALPRIYQKEARRVARPLIYEPETGVTPNLVYRHEMMEGIDGPPPPISAFVLTTVKSNPLVEVSLRSERPEPANGTILASWTYGLGRSVALTTDAGKRWANTWTEWPDYEKFFSQMIRWSMRPVTDAGKFSVATDLKDGRVRVVVTALDENDEFLNFLDISGGAVGPGLDPFGFEIRQIAPGRYVGEFEASKAGSYFLTLSPGAGKAPMRAGITVPYSSEFRVHSTNTALLEGLARQQPAGGEQGEMIGTLDQPEVDHLLRKDTFRNDLAKATSSQPVWPLVILVTAFVFFGDVFIRRVQLSYEWIAPVHAWVREKLFAREQVEDDGRMQRLRSRKAAVSSQIEQRKASTRFEPQVEEMPSPPPDVDQVLDELRSPTAPPPSRTPQTGVSASEPEEDSYTSRLLKAKQKAHRKKGN